jgi:flagellar protein FlbD
VACGEGSVNPASSALARTEPAQGFGDADDYPVSMIAVTRLDGSAILLNEDLIETIEQTPDTVLSLVNGHKLMVRDNPAQLVQRVIDFRRVVARSNSRGWWNPL